MGTVRGNYPGTAVQLTRTPVAFLIGWTGPQQPMVLTRGMSDSIKAQWRLFSQNILIIRVTRKLGGKQVCCSGNWIRRSKYLTEENRGGSPISLYPRLTPGTACGRANSKKVMSLIDTTIWIMGSAGHSVQKSVSPERGVLNHRRSQG